MTPDTPDIISAIPELEGEVPASQFARSEWFVPVMWGVVVLIALLAVGVIRWIRRHRKPPVAPPTQLQIALTRLQELEQQLPSLRVCSLRLSLIIRHFLQGQVHDPALYETHEEFSQRLDSLAAVPQQCRAATRDLLEKFVELKYAGNDEHDSAQARALIEQTRQLLQNIHDAQAAAQAADEKK